MINKRAHRRRLLTKLTGIWRRNPVLCMGLGLVPAVAASNSLKNGVTMTIAIAIMLIPTYLMASLLRMKKPQYLRIPVYAAISTAFFIPAVLVVTVFFPIALKDVLGVYLVALALDMAIVYRADSFARLNRVSTALVDALVNVVGFGVVICMLAAVREILGAGTIWGVKLWTLQIPGVEKPIFGFILLGMFAALVQFINLRVRRYRAEDSLLEEADRRPGAGQVQSGGVQG